MKKISSLNELVKWLLFQIPNIVWLSTLTQKTISKLEFKTLTFLGKIQAIELNSHPLNHRIGIKQPTHMTKPKAFNWTMRVSFGIAKLMVISMRANPIDRISLQRR